MYQHKFLYTRKMFWEQSLSRDSNPAFKLIEKKKKKKPLSVVPAYFTLPQDYTLPKHLGNSNNRYPGPTNLV